MNFSIVLEYLSNIFILRSFSSQEIEYWHGVCFDKTNGLDAVIYYLLDCEERQNLLSKNPTFIPGLREYNFSNILNEMKKVTNDPIILTFVIEEYCIGRFQISLAIELFSYAGIYDFKFQSLRMLEFAISSDYVRFINLLAKFEKKFPKDCEFCVLPLSYKLVQANKNIEQSKFIDDRLIVNVAQKLYQVYIDPHLYSLDRVVNIILSIFKLYINSHNIYKKIEAIIDTLINGTPAPALMKFNLVPIFVSGFWFSGSSAITDFLLSKRMIYCPFFKELEIYRLHGAIPDIIKDSELDFASYVKRIIIFFTVHICNIIIADQNIMSPLQTQYILSSEFTESENSFINYLNSFHSLAYHLYCLYKKANKNEVKSIFHDYICNISLRSVNNQHRYLILDNAITAPGIGVLKYTADNSIQIIVFRDPRDQYISLHARVGMKPNKFIDYINWCLDNISKEIDIISRDHRIIPVSYERFVLEEKYRHRLADKLNLDENSTGKYFFPKYSATRIGKWHSFSDQSAIEYIAESLPQLIDRSFINMFKENIED